MVGQVFFKKEGSGHCGGCGLGPRELVFGQEARNKWSPLQYHDRNFLCGQIFVSHGAK